MHTSTCTATAILNAIRACCVPGHSNKEWTVVPVVSWPPILRVSHQHGQIFYDCVEVE